MTDDEPVAMMIALYKLQGTIRFSGTLFNYADCEVVFCVTIYAFSIGWFIT